MKYCILERPVTLLDSYSSGVNVTFIPSGNTTVTLKSLFLSVFIFKEYRYNSIPPEMRIHFGLPLYHGTYFIPPHITHRRCSLRANLYPQSVPCYSAPNHFHSMITRLWMGIISTFRLASFPKWVDLKGTRPFPTLTLKVYIDRDSQK